jgi:hypothetical protein
VRGRWLAEPKAVMRLFPPHTEMTTFSLILQAGMRLTLTGLLMVEMPFSPPLGTFSRTRTMRSDSGCSKGPSRMPFTKLNIAVFAPIASAMVAIATSEKPGLLRSRRIA